jgi:hypothetical protein
MIILFLSILFYSIYALNIFLAVISCINSCHVGHNMRICRELFELYSRFLVCQPNFFYNRS